MIGHNFRAAFMRFFPQPSSVPFVNIHFLISHNPSSVTLCGIIQHTAVTVNPISVLSAGGYFSVWKKQILYHLYFNKIVEKSKLKYSQFDNNML